MGVIIAVGSVRAETVHTLQYGRGERIDPIFADNNKLLEKNMRKLFIVAAWLIAVCYISGCCETALILAGNGDVDTGSVGRDMAIEVCTSTEKEAANQLNILSGWYRTQWQKCFSNAQIIKCREELIESYNGQKKILLDLLQSMKGKSKKKQQQLYDEALKSPELIYLQ